MWRQNILLKPTDRVARRSWLYTQAAWGPEGRWDTWQPLVRAQALSPGRSPVGGEPAGAGLRLRCGACPFGSPPKAFIQIRSQWLITKIRITKFGSRNRLSNWFCLVTFFTIQGLLQRNKNISQSPSESELLFIFIFIYFFAPNATTWRMAADWDIKNLRKIYNIFLYLCMSIS